MKDLKTEPPPSALSALENDLLGGQLRPGWKKVAPAMWAEPLSDFVPMHWQWKTARAGLSAAGDLIDTTLAERRNLILVNSANGNTYATLRTMVSAYQMIRQGEQARTHRHVPNALRLMLEGQGAYTIVNGVRYEMEPGDVLLTPGWTWHGHGSHGPGDSYWLDFLDVPFIQLVEPMFFENHPDGYEAVRDDAVVMPFRFPWSESQVALASQPVSNTYGRLLELESAPLATMSLFFHQLDAGFKSAPSRTTANQIFAAHSGKGIARIEDAEVSWEAGDVFLVPPWHRLTLEAGPDSVLFRVSDERMQKALKLLRTSDG